MTQAGIGVETTSRRIRLSAAICFAIVVGCGAALVSAATVASIDRSRRAPLGDWLADFAKSSGLAGVCAVGAASLALWGILKQVSVARLELHRQSQVDESRAWWERFEWAAARAVPSSPTEVPLPYAAVLSTLTALTEAAKDDVQRTAIGAVMEVAANAARQPQDGKEFPEGRHTADARTAQALLNYARAAADTPARSTAVEAQLYELRVVEALARVLPDGQVKTKIGQRGSPTNPPMGPDAILKHRGRRIVAEVKCFQRTQALNSSVAAKVHQITEHVGAHAAIIISPVEMDTRSLKKYPQIVSAVWASPKDDGAIRRALDQAAAS